jgi:O-antigen ligase
MCAVDERLAVICLAGVAAVGAGVGVWARSFRVTVADILAAAVAVWYFVAAAGRVEPTKICECAALCMVWLAVRGSENPRRIVWFILLASLLQVLLCGAQTAGIAKSNHTFFPFTGSFINPGPLAGFLAATLFAYPYLWNRRGKIWLAIGFLATLATIVWSGSRASWVAVFVGAAVCLLPRIGKRTAVIIGVAAVVLCAGLYTLRPVSADGRLLIWKASASLVAEAPVFGNGADAFRREYMFHQAAYLEDKLLSDEAGLADTVAYAFNEPVRVLCEYGVVGFLLLGALVVCLIVRPSNRFVAAGLVAWLGFGLFSYPASVYPLRLLFIILAAMLARDGRTLWTIKLKAPLRIAAIAGFAALACAAVANYLDPKTDLDPDYLYRRGGELYFEKRYAEAIPVLEQAMRVAPSSLLLMDLGKCYDALGRTAEAEESLLTAVEMAPAYTTPAYELFDFYRREGRTADARRWAAFILARKFKTTNSLTLFARKQAREYLATTTPDDHSQM